MSHICLIVELYCSNWYISIESEHPSTFNTSCVCCCYEEYYLEKSYLVVIEKASLYIEPSVYIPTTFLDNLNSLITVC